MAILEDGTQDVTLHIILKCWLLSHDCLFLFFLFCVWFLLCVGCWLVAFMGLLTGLCTGPLPGLFCGYLLPDGLV